MHTQISDVCRYLGSVTMAPVIHKTRETHTHDYKHMHLKISCIICFSVKTLMYMLV